MENTSPVVSDSQSCNQVESNFKQNITAYRTTALT
ncbi:hypothetical protein BH11PSE12_BH11PSE12_26950 [soil metagenome]